VPAKKSASPPAARTARTRGRRSAEEKARRQVLDDLDDLHEHVQGVEDALSDIAEVQRVAAAATVVIARATHALLQFAAVEIPKAAGQPSSPELVAVLESLEEELTKLQDVNALMDHLDQYRDEVLKP
jgi:hypothetical protein